MDVSIALVGDDALCVIIHFLFTVRNVLLDMILQALFQLQLCNDLFIPLEQLDSVPAQEACRHLILDGFLNMCNGMLHTAGENVRQLAGGAGLGSSHSGLGSFVAALALKRAHLDHLAAHGVAQLLQVDLVAVLAHKVDHVDSHDDRDTQLDKLSGKVKVALDVGAVHNVQDDIGLFVYQIVTGNDLLLCVRRE